ncbi:MAG: hypothetical protein FWD36_06320 [Treponema sp.]|nr:hypothetical protein [Treponema sp.]
MKNTKMKAMVRIAGLIALAAVIFAGCASLGGGGSVRMPNDMVGKWYASADAAAAGDESQLQYEVKADGTVIRYGGEEPVTAQITSFKKGEEVHSFMINDVEINQKFSFFSINRKDEAAGTQTLTLLVSDAPKDNPVFVNGRSFKATAEYTAPAAKPTYDAPPASDAGQLIGTWTKPGNTPVTIQFTAAGRMIYGSTDNAYRVSGNNIVIDNNTSNVLQYSINGNQLTISSSNIALGVMLGGTYTRQ